MKMRIRKNNQNLWVPMLSSGVNSPRFAVRYGGQNYYAPLATSAGKPCLAVKVNGSTKYLKLQSSYLTSWLKFDESAVKDECGNVWTANSDATTISATDAFSGNALTGDVIRLSTPIMLGGQDFTISFWFKATTNDGQTVFVWRDGESLAEGAGGLLGIERSKTGKLAVFTGAGAHTYVTVSTTNTLSHYAIVYQHSAQTVKVYCNGTLIVTKTGVTINRVAHTARLGSVYPVAVDEFKIFDGIALWTSNFTPPPAYLVSWLKFDESATKDMCGNIWTANSSATLTSDNAISGKALTDGTVTLDSTIALGGQDFTVDFWFKRAASSFYPHVFLWRNGESATGGAGGLFGLEVDPNGRLYLWNAAGSSFSVDYNTTQTTHCAFVYQHASGTLKVYLDGVLKTTKSVTIARVAYTAQLMCYSNHILYVDEFRVFDGIAKWTSDFTPPTASDY